MSLSMEEKIKRKEKKYVLVATDVARKDLDFPDTSMLSTIYDMSVEIVKYVHRID